MVKKSLTDKLRTGLYTGLAAGILGLTGCGGGSGYQEPITTNYNPEANPSNLNLNLDMPPDSVLEVELANPTDKNPGDNPVFYNSAESLEVNPILGSYSENTNTTPLTIESYGSDSGDYKIKLNFGNVNNGVGNEILEGRILEFPEKIAFWSNRPVPEGGYNEDIYKGYIVNGVLTDVKRLTTNSGQDLESTYSPDGKELLFTSHRTGGTAVWRMDEDGSNQRDITSDIVERARQADWCSNGLIVVAYRDKGDSEAGIGIINPDKNSFNPIYSEPRTGSIPSWPSWSPDCSKVAFEKYDGSWNIWKIDADGNNLINLTNDPAIDGLPDWSNRYIFFRSYRFGSADIHRMDADGNNIIRITDNPGIESEPKISSDGNKLMFTHDIDFSNPQIYMMNSDGTGEWTQLTFNGANRYPAFKPN